MRREREYSRALQKIRDSIPEALKVEMAVTSSHEGWRVWVSFGKDRDRTISDAGSWAMWPHGLSLGAGNTPGSALSDARSRVESLRNYLVRYKLIASPCPTCGRES